MEQKRLNIPRDQPVAVQQWEGLIAVNYAARAAGISRHMRVADALAKLPTLRLVHVETIGAQHMPSDATSDVGIDSRSTSKACLHRYRAASTDVLAVVHRVQPQVVTVALHVHSGCDAFQLAQHPHRRPSSKRRPLTNFI